MDPSTYKRIQEIVTKVLALPLEARERAIQESCDGDAEALELVRRLLGQGPVAEDAFDDKRIDRHRRVLEGGLEADGHPSEWTPDNIGPYRVQRLIGRGGMGAVFLARQRSPDRVVAIKLLHPARSSDESILRLQREAEILGALRHPGIAQIHEASTFDGGFGDQPYIVMEFVDGRTVVDHADALRLGERARIELVISIAEASQHAHEHGIIHRDLKPDNVLVDEYGQTKLLDFGIASLAEGGTLGGLTLEGQVLGTVSYMPPEQARRGAGSIGPAADVFSAGAIAFELLTGRPPRSFEGLPLTDVLRELAETPAPEARSIRPGLARDLNTILGCALETRPEDRYATMAAFATDLQRYLDQRPIRARPPSAVDRTAKFVRRHRTLVTGATLLVLTLVGGLVATSLQAQRAKRAEENAQLERYAAEMLTATSRVHDPVVRGLSGTIVDRGGRERS